MLASEFGETDEEIASLISQIAMCEGESSTASTVHRGSDYDGGSSSSVDSAEESSGYIGGTSLHGYNAVSSSSDSSTIVQETSSQDDGSTDEGSSYDGISTNDVGNSMGGGGDFTFSGRQSWNYNLGSPVDTSVDVDVFFIDMGE